MKRNKIAILFVALAILLWGTTPAVAKLLLRDLTNIQILFFTTLFATIGLFLISLFSGKLHHIKKYRLKDYLTFSYMGFLGVFLFFFFLFKALSILSAQEASIINFLWPIIVVVFSFFLLKEEFTIQKLLGIVLSFIGVFVVITKGNIFSFKLENVTGVFFALFGALFYGLFSVLSKKYNYERLTSTMFYYLFAFFYNLVAVVLFSSIPSVSWQQLFGLLWLGIFTSGIAFVSWFLALKYGDTARMANFIFLTPFLSLVYIYFLIGEKILLPSILGLLIIVAGIIIQTA